MTIKLPEQAAREAFNKFASGYDTFSNDWQDMGADAYFIAGYVAAINTSQERVHETAKSEHVWLPIESAPMDTPILVGPTKRMGICVAMNHTLDGWVTETCGEWITMYTPTHWMPLPPAPEVK